MRRGVIHSLVWYVRAWMHAPSSGVHARFDSTALAPRHELGDHAVEAAPLVPVALLSQAQLLEVLSLRTTRGGGGERSGRNVGKKGEREAGGSAP